MGAGSEAGPPFLLSPVSFGFRVTFEFGKEAGNVCYVRIDVHRKRSQVAVVDQVSPLVSANGALRHRAKNSLADLKKPATTT